MSGHDETIHPDYIPEDFRELLRMACDSVWEQGELYSEDLLLAAFKPAIDPDVYLEVQHPCWSCNSNSSSANASAGVR